MNSVQSGYNYYNWLRFKPQIRKSLFKIILNVLVLIDNWGSGEINGIGK